MARAVNTYDIGTKKRPWSDGRANVRGNWREDPDIYVCGPLKKPWAEFWPETEDFG